MRGRWSVIVPFVEEGRTEWHPADRAGPFAKLVRGSWVRVTDAIKWAWENIPGSPYELRYYPPWCVRCGEDSTDHSPGGNFDACPACTVTIQEQGHAL